MFDFFPGVPRPQQREAMEWLYAAWGSHDAFAIQMPTGTGKSNFAKAIADWQVALGSTVAVVAPDSPLQEQYERAFPDMPSLWAADTYRCRQHPRKTCDQAAKLKRLPCNPLECPYRALLARSRAGSQLMHTYTYQGNHGAKKRLPWADVAVFDEAHKLKAYLAAQAGVSLWHFMYKWPLDLAEQQDVLAWVDQQRPTFQLKRARALIRAGAAVTKEYADYRNDSRLRLRVEPLTLRDHPPILWPPRAVKKLVLLSATFNANDVHELGLDRYFRVGYCSVGSPIPAGRRPIQVMPFVPMAQRHADVSLPVLAEKITQLAAYHAGQRGVVHATYADMSVLRPLLSSPRFLWHDQLSKQRVINDFISGVAGPDRVLVGAGLHEGLDLAGPRATWQVLTKVPRLDLATPQVAMKAELEPEWYAWESIKSTIQACGRVCRGPDDYGVTYVFDPWFAKLFAEYNYLWPLWFQDSVRW